jgi:Leucine-rich repeat (LRR) protein
LTISPEDTNLIVQAVRTKDQYKSGLLFAESKITSISDLCLVFKIKPDHLCLSKKVTREDILVLAIHIAQNLHGRFDLEDTNFMLETSSLPFRFQAIWAIGFSCRLSHPYTSKIIYLDISAMDLDSIPDTIFHMTNLRVLNLSKNNLSDINITGKFTHFKKLEHLYLNDNQLGTFPEQLLQLTNLQTLNLNNNIIAVFIDSFLGLHNLKKLCLNNNHINELPAAIKELTQLEVLEMSNNAIAHIPADLCSLENLLRIDLSTNFIKTLPVAIGQLQSLEELHLNNCKIKELPDSLCNLSKLRVVDIHENNLNKLPEQIGNLKDCQRLYIYNNPSIKELPKSFGELYSLEYLDLNGTSISKLPTSFGNLVSLIYMTYSNGIGVYLEEETIETLEEHHPFCHQIRIHQRLLSIQNDIVANYHCGYQKPTIYTTETLQVEYKRYEKLKQLLQACREIQIDIANLEFLSDDLYSEEFKFQQQWIMKIRKHQLELSEEDRELLNWVVLPLSQEQVVNFSKWIKKRQWSTIIVSKRYPIMLAILSGAAAIIKWIL